MSDTPAPWRDPRKILPALWAFLMFNFIYCDILGLYYAPDLNQLIDGHIGDLDVTQGFLLGAGLLMETSMVMFLLASLAPRKVVRVVSMVVPALLVVAQVSSLFVGDGNTLHYVFFSIVEIGTLIVIAIVGSRWRA